MIRGLYNAASGMIAQERRHDTVTQNIANINTNGYKQVNSVQRTFPEMLISMIGGNAQNPNRQVGRMSTGVFAEESISMHLQGALRETGKTTDLALVTSLELLNPATGENYPFDASGKYVNENGDVVYRPEGFFTVQNANGDVLYTRDGSFRVSPEGNLITSGGYQVLDNNNNPIVLTGPVSNLKVNEQGQIVDADGNVDATIGISVVQQPHQLIREGEGVFRLRDQNGSEVRWLAAQDNAVIRQGYIEASNVDPAQAMVDLMAALRAYETNQKVVQFYDKSLEKAVNEIGRV